MRLKRVYVAGPMGSDLAKRRQFVIDASTVALRLVQAGIAVYLPHLWDYVEGANDKTIVPTEQWMAQDLEWVSICDAVLRLPGKSPGADREVERARSLNIPVFLSEEDLIAWIRGYGHIMRNEA